MTFSSTAPEPDHCPYQQNATPACSMNSDAPLCRIAPIPTQKLLRQHKAYKQQSRTTTVSGTYPCVCVCVCVCAFACVYLKSDLVDI